jgi:hypothetical protein
MDVLGGAAALTRRAPARARLHRHADLHHSRGANILTRTLMIFGQGAIRSPVAYREIDAITATAWLRPPFWPPSATSCATPWRHCSNARG